MIKAQIQEDITCSIEAISAIVCTKKDWKSPVDLDMFLSVGYNRNVENCPLRGIVLKRAHG